MSGSSDPMSSGRFRVHRQGNGARIIVSEEDPDADPPSDVDDSPLPKKKRRLPASTVPVKRMPTWFDRWGPAIGYGTAATLACSIVYNAIVFATWVDFRLLAIVSGSAIGLAVRAGAPEVVRINDQTSRWIAVVLTYACLASTYTAWIYDELVNPTDYADLVAVEEEDLTGAEPVVLSIDAPRAGLEIGVHVDAAIQAVGWSAVLPFYLLRSMNVFGIVFLMAAIVQAWKLGAVVAK